MIRKKRKAAKDATNVEAGAVGSNADADDRVVEVVTETSPPAEPNEQVSAEAEPVDEVEALRQQLEEAEDKRLRAVAELQNFQRRATTERQEAIRYASADLIRSVLPVVDDIERTLAAAEDVGGSSLVEGVKLIHQNLVKALEAHHVERIEAAGLPFDRLSTKP